MFEDLRSFLRALEEKGDLVRITRPVSPRFEIAAGIRKTSEINGPALLFENVTGHSMPVAAGLYASRRRALAAFEASEGEIHEKFMRGLRNPIGPRMVASGPCKEVILKGRDADFSKLPICTHNLKDAGPYITLGLGFARHPEYGNNVSISRIQIFDGQTAGVRSVRPQHLGVYFEEAEKRGEPLQFAITIGNDPQVTFCSQISGSVFLDELGVAGGWMGKPVDLVKCETIDLAVPATSEIVIEGELTPGNRRMEGPFGEFPGYYQGIADQAVFTLKAITHRRNPIYVTALTGTPTTDNHVMTALPKESILYERIRQICPTIRDVCFTKGGVGMHVAISIKPTFVTQARDVMLAAFTTERIRPKLVIVVDDDIDVRNPEQIEWALATRFQADKDLVILPHQRGFFLDPSTPAVGESTIMGIDATRPFGTEFPEVAQVPGAEEFVIPGWDNAARR
jgi:4-hydroxy-3-polyprenylbenzoate decarboxylase/2,5-furandicarboxylate decarboxylase 1